MTSLGVNPVIFVNPTIVWIGEISWFPQFGLEVVDSNIPIIETGNKHMRMLRMDINAYNSNISLADKLRVGRVLNRRILRIGS